MKKKLFISLVFLFIVSSAAFAADVLDIGTSARSLGMARTYVGISNVGECVFGNPAGLYGLKKIELVSMYTQLSGDVQYTLLGVAIPTSYGKWGFGYASNKTGDIFATTLDATTGRVATLEPFSYGTDMFLVDYSNKINNNLAYGLRYKYEKKGSGYSSVGYQTGMSLDLSALYKINDQAEAGFVASNVFASGIDHPMLIDLGGKYKFSNVSWYGDVSLRTTMPPEMRTGVEWNAWQNLDLRAGVEQRNSSFSDRYINYSAGVGYRFESFRVDYAYYYDSILTYNSRHYVSIAFSLPEPKSKYSNEPIVVDSGDRTVTTAESIILLGRVNRSVTKVRWKNKLADVNEGSYSISVNLKVGKNKIFLSGEDDYGNVKGSVEARELRLKWYKDINRYKWASQSIEDLATLGVHGSLSRDIATNYLRPGEGISRLEMAAILARAANMPTKKLSKPVSKDVSTLHWGSSYIQNAITNNWLSLYPDGTFKPTRKVNRAEGVSIIVRFAAISPAASLGSEPPYADIPLNYWGAKYIDAAKKAGLLDYVRGNKFVPGGNLTRAEVFDLLAKTKYMKDRINYLLDFDKGF